MTQTNPRKLLVARSTTIDTAMSDAPVASGPSRVIDLIISAKTVERLAVRTSVCCASGRTTLSVVAARRSKLRPFERETLLPVFT